MLVVLPIAAAAYPVSAQTSPRMLDSKRREAVPATRHPVAGALPAPARTLEISPTAASQSAHSVGDYAFNRILIQNDTVKTTPNRLSVFGVAGLSLLDRVGVGHTDARNVITSEIDLDGASDPSTKNRNYVPFYGRGIANVGDGGTPNVPLGAMFGANFVCQLNAGATHYLDCTAIENDVGGATGASTIYRVGTREASIGNVQGSGIDTAVDITTLGAPGVVPWRSGITFDAVGGKGSAVDGELITANQDVGVKQIARAGIDFLGFTFTNLDMALPGSDGNMLVLKTGIVQAPGLVTTTPAGGSALSGNGYKVDSSGNASFKSCRSSGDSDVGGTLSAKNLSSPLFTPATSKAPCTKGQFAYDSNFEYVCIAPNTWRRAALSDF